MADREQASDERDAAGRSAASASAALAPDAVPAALEVLALQRTIGNAAVGRLLARQVSPPEAPTAPELQQGLAQLDRGVQEVLRRYARTGVARPAGGWRTYRRGADYIDFDWLALLFVLHQTNTAQGAQDYMTVLRALMIPALRHAANRSETGRTPANLPNFSVLTSGEWIRNPPPSVRSNPGRRAAYEQLIQGTEQLLTAAGTRARQANITDLSIPGRRDQDFAFIMGGAEAGGARNQFYRQAGNVYRERVGRDHVTTVGSLEEVFNWIRNRARRFRRRGEDVPMLGTIYIVSHANRSGFLSFRMTRRGERGFYGFELAQAIAAGYDRGDGNVERLEPLEADVGVDHWTRVFIRGCDVGRDTEMLNALRDAFGGEVLVHAPKEAQYYGPVEASGRGAVGEGLADTYWLEFPADERGVDDNELARRLSVKYPTVGVDGFREWLRRSRQRNEFTVSRSDYVENWGPFTVDYPTARDVPRDRASQEADIRGVIQGSPHIRARVRFEECSWRIGRVGRSVVGNGRRRHFSIHVVRRDAQGRLTQYTVRDRSVYGIDERPISQRQTSVPWP